MSPIIFWMFGLSASTAMLVGTVALDVRLLQFSLSFVIIGFIALAGLRDQRVLQSVGAYPSHVTATMVRHMGLMYGWAAVMIVLLYTTLLEWTLWFGAFFVMCVGATLCLFLANIIMRDLTEETTDRRMSALVKSIAKAQFGVTCLSIGGLLALGASATSSGAGGAWAGVNVMLAAAIGLGALSAYVIFFPRGFEFEDDQQVPDEEPRAATKKAEDMKGRAKPQRPFGRARPA